MVIRVSLFALFAFVSMAMRAQELEIVVSNSLDFQRQEIVEVAASDVRQRLGIAPTKPLVVHNALGQEVASQTTSNGLLLFEASVRPNATATYTVSGGQPKAYTSFVGGKVYQKRLDDLTFENDRAIYRMYGPALQATGERSFGTDIWTKSTPYLDADNRYEAEFAVRDTVAALRKQGREAEAKEIIDGVSYHLNHGTGYDAYGCGPTLGCGAPAIMVDGQLQMPYCWQQCDITDNGPLRFSAHLEYGTTRIEGLGDVTEHRLISLDKGSNFCKITVWYEGLKKDCHVASGVVIHSADTTSIALSPHYALYADPTDRPQAINEQVYVGTLYPYEAVKTRVLPFAEKSDAIYGHAIGETVLQPDGRFTYYFGSAWSANDVRTFDEWKLRAQQFVEAMQTPLEISMQE